MGRVEIAKSGFINTTRILCNPNNDPEKSKMLYTILALYFLFTFECMRTQECCEQGGP